MSLKMEKDPNDFRDYQSPLNLFENFRDGELNTKEVLRDQVRLYVLVMSCTRFRSKLAKWLSVRL